MTRITRVWAAAVGVVAALGVAASAQQFRSGVDLVRLPVVVTPGGGVPEVGHHVAGPAYAAAARAYSLGTAAGVGAWIRYCCDAYSRGAEEGLAICARQAAR